MLSLENYDIINWVDHSNKVDLDKDLRIKKSWSKLIRGEMKKDYFKEINKVLDKRRAKNVKVFPYPSLVFNAFNTTPLYRTKVVILGQDPYFNMREGIPEAMGLSFSVPVGIPVPSSLKNIYKNLKKFNHIEKIPTHGNLTKWAKQGCLMLNTSLTVEHKNKNCHEEYWKPFSDNIIKYLSKNKENLVFVLWGAPALKKYRLIDSTKHEILISSHPSGLSCNKRLRSYSSFNEQDHFGLINKHLKRHKKKQIDWNIE